MAPETSTGEAPDPQHRARESVEHLQAAARELIAAARAALDVAEDWVNDPEAAESLAGSIATVSDVAKRVTGTGGWLRTASGGPMAGSPDADADGRVQRINVT
jgi:hypothetical protein